MSSPNRNISKLYAWSFIAVLLVFCLLFWLLPKSLFSELENRNLQAAPHFSWSKLFDGSFTKESETFITDHFPFRDYWVQGKSIMEQLRLQKENNGIYYGKDGYLLEKLEQPDYEKLSDYMNAVNQFAKHNADNNIVFLLAPTSIGMYPEKLPVWASNYSQKLIHEFVSKQLASSVTWMDGLPILEPYKNSDKQLYYKTDHHWTTYGAYLAYEAYAKQMGWKPLSEQEYDITTVTNQFLGSYHTRSLFAGAQPDHIEQYTPKEDYSVELNIIDTDTKSPSLYDPSYLTKKDKYSYFQGGVHALMEIHSEAPHTDLDKLLIIKDSYAHSLIPFLTAHVKEIHVIDIRYYNGNINQYMKEHQIHDALLMFNSTTFATEQNLLKLKYE